MREGREGEKEEKDVQKEGMDRRNKSCMAGSEGGTVPTGQGLAAVDSHPEFGGYLSDSPTVEPPSTGME